MPAAPIRPVVAGSPPAAAGRRPGRDDPCQGEGSAVHTVGGWMFRGFTAPLTDRSERDRDSTASPWAYIRTETGSAAVLLAATLAALAWVNIAPGDYASVWSTRLSVRLGDARRRPGPARVGEQRADDAVLPGGGPGGAARVRHGRAARPQADRPADAGRGQRHGGAGRDLPGGERGARLGARLGRGDVDGHRVRAGHAGAARRPLPAPAAHLHPHRGRGGRLRGARGDRRGVQRRTSPGRRCWWASGCWR